MISLYKILGLCSGDVCEQLAEIIMFFKITTLRSIHTWDLLSIELLREPFTK